MDIRLSFPGGKRVDAHLGQVVVHSDQSPLHGGDGSAPEPFELFLASLAACAGVYVLGFCQARSIATDGIEIVQHHDFDLDTKRLARVRIDISVPKDFPAQYVVALERVAAKCTVKRVIQDAPEFVVQAQTRESEAQTAASPAP
jgi:putative redox protein